MPVAASGCPIAIAPPFTLSFVAIDPQLALHSDELRGKRFVDLESIDLT